jgi:hypothetical protein
MDAGSGMLYPSETVDGITHLFGGLDQRRFLLEAAGSSRVPQVGESILVKSSKKLMGNYDRVAHCFPPFVTEERSIDNLSLCYVNVLRSCLEDTPRVTNPPDLLIFFPLLGAGCRGFGVREAARAAANGVSLCETLLESLQEGRPAVSFLFCCLEDKHLDELRATLDKA